MVKTIYQRLAEKFWPGPLTIVYHARTSIPALITANTGFIGVRSPSHVIARRLLLASQLPIAAPSANRFGHVSPTTAQHVVDDLGDSELAIIDGGAGACEIGLESTVCKIDEEANQITLLRAGAVTRSQIVQVLQNIPGATHWNVAFASYVKRTAEDSPGMFTRHYAPDVSTSLVKHGDSPFSPSPEQKNRLRKCAVIDFGDKLKHLSSLVKSYVDLSEIGDANEAATKLFSTLRHVEAQQLAGRSLSISSDSPSILLVDLAKEAAEDEMVAALYDRMSRAASGSSIDLRSM